MPITVDDTDVIVVEIEVPAEEVLIVDGSGPPGPAGEQGNDGWSPRLAVVADGERRVLQVVNWEGGTGPIPPVGQYLGDADLVTDIADAIDVRGSIGGTGPEGPAGTPGAVVIGEGVDILTGAGVPDPSLGAINQLYLDTVAGDIYKKMAGGWVVVANIRGPAGPRGVDGTIGLDGAQGPQGFEGWSPVFAMATDFTGTKRILQLVDWIGGAGPKPVGSGLFVGPVGLVSDPAMAVDIRGPQGAAGTDGTNGLPGAKGDIGLTGQDGASIYAGPGVPDDTTHLNGDIYIDNTTGNFYKKIAGVFVVQGNLLGPRGLQGVPGNQGIAGPPGSSVLFGTVDPVAGIGNDLDVYINTTSGDVFKKTGGAWGAPIGNVKGPAGPAGAKGDIGDDGAVGPIGPRGSLWVAGTGSPSITQGIVGDMYLDRNSGDIYGPKPAADDWGSPIGSIKGPAGDPGTAGAPGAKGDAGVKGDPGLAFISGVGVPNNAVGVDGDTYYNTATGDIYTKADGLWGTPRGNLTGPMGSGGPVGPRGNDFLLDTVPPLAGRGNVGDTYLNTSTGDLYEKVGVTSWALRGNTKGVKGDTGAAGTAFRLGNGVPPGSLGIVGDSFVDLGTGILYGKVTLTTWDVIGDMRGPAGPGGPRGDPGINGFSFRSAAGVPAPTLGNVGDTYVNTTNGDLYTKTNPTNWNLAGNIEGPAGGAGVAGPAGAPGVGVPAGGTTGQALVKTSATDFATAWANVSGGGGGSLPVGGTTGQILAKNSNTDQDAGWINPPSGGGGGAGGSTVVRTEHNFSSVTTTDVDPGAGKYAMTTSSFSSLMAAGGGDFFISNTDVNGVSVAATLAAIPVSDLYRTTFLRLWSTVDPSFTGFACKITAVATRATYTKVSFIVLSMRTGFGFSSGNKYTLQYSTVAASERLVWNSTGPRDNLPGYITLLGANEGVNPFMYCIPFSADRMMRIKSFTVQVNVKATSGSCRFGVYRMVSTDNQFFWLSGLPVIDSGVSTTFLTTTGTRTFPVTATDLPPGNYCAVMACGGTLSGLQVKTTVMARLDSPEFSQGSTTQQYWVTSDLTGGLTGGGKQVGIQQIGGAPTVYGSQGIKVNFGVDWDMM